MGTGTVNNGHSVFIPSALVIQLIKDKNSGNFLHCIKRFQCFDTVG